MIKEILVIEDTSSLREVLCQVLRSEGYKVTGVGSAEKALEKIDTLTEDSTLVLSDLKLPGISGLDFLKESKKTHPLIPVVVMTAYGSIDIAVKAMKEGASDFITKPFNPEMLCQMIKDLSTHKRIISRNPNTEERNLITQNPIMEELLEQIRKIASIDSSVLILGESGTGKELVAREIHRQSKRKDKKFIAVNCASMPGELLESEFFGHEAGAFTGATTKRIGLFEISSEGSLFLDEIGNMPLNLQVKLLRTLQESEIKRLGANKPKKINTRVISATNSNLEEQIKKGNFREDLYYRLGVIVLEVPPLRERVEDIELLSNYFIKQKATQLKKTPPKLSKEALSTLKNYLWPGNVRELENTIERTIIFLEKDNIEKEDIELKEDNNLILTNKNSSFLSLQDISNNATKEAEKKAIKDALKRTKGNKSKAAKLLKVSYKTILNKIKEYEI